MISLSPNQVNELADLITPQENDEALSSDDMRMLRDTNVRLVYSAISCDSLEVTAEDEHYLTVAFTCKPNVQYALTKE